LTKMQEKKTKRNRGYGAGWNTCLGYDEYDARDNDTERRESAGIFQYRADLVYHLSRYVYLRRIGVYP
jgi:hypothetical protein